MNITQSVKRPIQHEEISARAQELWQKNNSPAGRDEEFWLAAEHELTHEREDIAQEQHGDVTPPRSTPGGGESRREENAGSPQPVRKTSRR